PNKGRDDGSRPQIDLTKIVIPVLAINGEFDRPNAKTYRMQRQLANFTSVVLPGKSHLSAIAADTIPPLYIETLVEFINSHDARVLGSPKDLAALHGLIERQGHLARILPVSRKSLLAMIVWSAAGGTRTGESEQRPEVK